MPPLSSLHHSSRDTTTTAPDLVRAPPPPNHQSQSSIRKTLPWGFDEVPPVPAAIEENIPIINLGTENGRLTDRRRNLRATDTCV